MKTSGVAGGEHVHATKLVVGNWKMNGRRGENSSRHRIISEQLQDVANVEVGICVPFPYLGDAEYALRGTSIGWGVQDLSSQNDGAYTGDVSAAMAADFGCRYAIIGHSERRTFHGENSATIAMKVQRAVECGLIPIVCIGESLSQRESGRTARIVSDQLEAVLDLLSVQEAIRLVVAYEPVWAIGTGKSALPSQAAEVHDLIRALLCARSPELAPIPLIYGGSVKAGSAAELFQMRNIDGALVGGASLDPSEFVAICLSASRINSQRCSMLS